MVAPRRHIDALAPVVPERIEQTSLLLLPVFFTVTGLSVNIAGLGWEGLVMVLAVVLVACAGKFVGAAGAAKLSGSSSRAAATLGVLLNARGLTELVILSVGLRLGVLDTQLFTAMVVMAVLTTATGLCVLAHLDRPSRNALLAALASQEGVAVPVGRERTTLEARLREIRYRGFSTLDRRRQSTDATSIAVPVSVPGGPVRGAITLRFAKAALTLPVAIARFVPALREAAHRVAARAGDPSP